MGAGKQNGARGKREQAQLGEMESHRRRAVMIRELFREGSINIKEFRERPSVKRSFRYLSLPTLTADLGIIADMLNNAQSQLLAHEERGLRVIAPRHSAFEHLGYAVAFEPGSPTEEKNRIAKYIVDQLLVAQDIVYLATGTTVFQIGVELLRSEASKVNTVLTHNLAIVDLWRGQGRLFPRRQNPIDLIILAGKADFEQGDIVSDEDLSVLSEWQCTKTFMSCTALNAATGQVFSFRQPNLKKTVLRNMRGGKLIIPVTTDKIGSEAGGQRIPLPDVEKIVVTTALPNKQRAALEAHGFQVREADRQ
jgi:DeoR/GlpR family transcriptional regulator of sugar metabolism